MPTKLVWRRCGTCGQLTLVPVNANVCWQCGAPLNDPRGEPDPNPGSASADAQPEEFPERIAWPPFSFAENLSPQSDEPNPLDPRAIDRNLPPAKPRPMDLSPEDDIVATQLLDSVFPDGVTL